MSWLKKTVNKIVPKEIRDPGSMLRPGGLLGPPKPGSYGYVGGGGGSRNIYKGIVAPDYENLTLNPFTRQTDTNLTFGEESAENLATRLITGTEGDFRRQLSGRPDYAQVDRLTGIQQREFQQNIMPSIQGQLATAGVRTAGASRRATMDASLGLSDQAAEMRFQAFEMAKQEALAAAQILPGLTAVSGLTRNNEINNILRDMEKHSLNEGLKAQEWEANFKVANQKFSDAMALASGVRSGGGRAAAPTQDIQQRTNALSLLGGVAGAAIGFFGGGGPVGAAIGWQAGTGVGAAVGGDFGAAINRGGGALNTAVSQAQYNEGRAAQAAQAAPRGTLI
jgi:hypothetical protein